MFRIQDGEKVITDVGRTRVKEGRGTGLQYR